MSLPGRIDYKNGTVDITFAEPPPEGSRIVVTYGICVWEPSIIDRIASIEDAAMRARIKDWDAGCYTLTLDKP